MLTRDQIRERIPHAGAMCLLESIESADDKHVVARACSHRDPENPLRHDGRVHAVCGIEYAAQAMAVHASLSAAQRDRPAGGFLASVRDCRFQVERLDDIAADLHIRAERLSAADDSFIYAFTISAQDRTLLSGRVAVKLMGLA